MIAGRIVVVGALAAATSTAAPAQTSPEEPWQRTYALSVPVPAASRARLFYERNEPLWAGRSISGADPIDRVGIEFKPRSASASLREIGTFRLQLSRSSNVSLRPRKGGVALSWRKSF